MNTWWEGALIGQYPIVAYLCIPSELPEFQRKAHSRAVHAQNAQTTFLSQPETDSDIEQNTTQTGKYVQVILRLPYTETMLARRYEHSADCPSWYLWERIPTCV